MPVVFFGLMKEVEEVCQSAVQEIKKNPKLAQLKIFLGRKPKDIVNELQDLGRCARRYHGQRFKNMPLHEALNDELISDLWTFADAALLIASISGYIALCQLDSYHHGSGNKKIVPSSVTKANGSFEQSLRCIALAEKLWVKRGEIYRLLSKHKK